MVSSQSGRPSPGSSHPLSAYWTFYREVAARQLAEWLPPEPVRLLDLSDRPDVARQAAGAGHEVVHVTPETVHEQVARRRSTGCARSSRIPRILRFSPTRQSMPSWRNGCRPHWLPRPPWRTSPECCGRGRLLLRVDSLLLGMAQLAQQQAWAELSDAPSAEVLLVPSPEGTITRCFWPEQLDELLTGAGLEAEWIRPRTVLSPSVVQRALADDPGVLPDLIETELSLPDHQIDESAGIHLMASARRPHT